MRLAEHIISFFGKEFNKFNNTVARMLTLLYVLYINLEMSSTMIFFCFFALLRCPRTNLAWLPER